VVDRIDDVVVLRKIKLFDATARDQVVDGNAVALGIDRQNAFAQHLDLGTIDATVQRVNLTIGVADVDVVVIDERDMADAGTRAGLGGPGTDTADSDDAELCALQRVERGFSEYPAEAFESLQVLRAWHLMSFLTGKFHCCAKIAQDSVFTRNNRKKSRINDSVRLRTSVPLEGEYFLWNQ
jgi:hypothetical protein